MSGLLENISKIEVVRRDISVSQAARHHGMRLHLLLVLLLPLLKCKIETRLVKLES